MQPIALNDVLDIARYEKMRPDFRREAMEAKDKRRLQVGPVFTFLFENRTTVLYQIQEMMRAERIVEDRAIQHEIDTYNELLPPPGGLGASLLIEYTDKAERLEMLRKLVGVHKHVKLVVGDAGEVPGEFDTRQMSDERVSSVQYVRFNLQDEHRQAWLDAAEAGKLCMVIDHPAYTHEAQISVPVARALAEDFATV